MPQAREIRKTALIEETLSRLRATDEALAGFAADLYGQGAAEDLVLYTPEDLIAFAALAWEDFASHTHGTHRISVFNPAFRSAGTRAAEVSVVEIVNDNMPFLVDSVLDELQDSGLDVHLVLHPIYEVERDGDGRLRSSRTARGTAAAGARRESLIHIHVARIDTEEAMDALRGRLDQVLKDVRAAVSDWHPMRARFEAAIQTYRNSPPPLAVDELGEAIQFLDWMADNNFIFLGMREYTFDGGVEEGDLSHLQGTGLGLLADPSVRVLRRGSEFVLVTPEIRDFLKKPEPLIIAKANVKSRVHRRVHMDYVGVKLFDEEGTLTGELRIVGLFTAVAYTETTGSIPYLRRKVATVLAKAGYDPDSHSGRALMNVMESYPRDELFQVDVDTLYHFALAILQLDERPRIRVLARRDKFDRYVSILCFVPRDRYTTDVRLRIGAHFAEAFDGRVSAWYVSYPEGPLARVHFIIGRDRGETPDPAQEDLEKAVADVVRTWGDGLREALRATYDPATARHLSDRYAGAFHGGYKDVYSADAALSDIRTIETLSDTRQTAIRFYRRDEVSDRRLSLKAFHREAPLPLTARVPLLENMGFRVINERTYRITPTSLPLAYLHEMTLETSRDGDVAFDDAVKERLEALYMAVWLGQAESDGYNALVLTAGLPWRDIAMLRALSRYLRQAGIRYSEDYMWTTLNNYPPIAQRLVELFHIRFNPAMSENDRTLGAARLENELAAAFDEVVSLDDDRILRRFQNVIDSVLRTNFFQLDSHGQPKPTFAFKIDSRRIDELPQPRPFREIFVYSPRVEGVHLRFGKVARGGLRWSDRPQDFRTEVLGLVKAQQVKNAVIVPVGAKGGFVPKRLPAGGDREAVFREGTEAYKIFVSSLLDVTDNLKDDRIVPPADVVRHDGDDPYLVVAADKGTATFSDTANGLSESRDFWLGDAFASGGSAGYDHKKMGITARGAWEAVKRHFREMNRDIQKEPFTVAGVGDMSGDVFGNGMLLSRAIRLVAAFDHRDIFLDPDPDAARSFAERKRLFELGRSSWQDYDAALISEGGGVFSRQLKSIPLSPQMQALLRIDRNKATPQEVMAAILKMPVDLLWFGGIGTYVRARSETDADVGDRANDAIRVTAAQLRAKVVGEGANLGMTQLARIEYGRAGGRCNSDAIDNSAGVNSSDMEVNIKIALGAAVQSGRLDVASRNRLLADMTDEVADLVLRNNYLQTLAISMTERRGAEDFGYQVRMMRQLEQAGHLDRQVEHLPDDAALAELEKAGQTLIRAELGVLLAYAKITLFDALLDSPVPDDAYLGRELFRYFPDRMAEDYQNEISGHRLRREIISTMLANSMINRGGPSFLTRIMDQTGATAAEIAQGFVAVRNSFALTELNNDIDALDTRVDGALQLELYGAVQELFLDQIVWFKRHVSFQDGIAAVVERFRTGIEALAPKLEAAVTPAEAGALNAVAARHEAEGVPKALARRLAWLPVEATVPDIVLVAEDTGAELETAARSFFEVAAHFRIGAMDALARDLVIADYYDGLALDRARAMLAAAHRQLTGQAIRAGGFARWLASREGEVARTTRTVGEILEGALSVSKFAVAAGLLAEVAR
ncbi:NAD-glutamate dehydrogenase [Polymorphum gilvum]|uniref:Bacterial NAD-glutamate dehydrogenase superfamily n=1 Tax=Polymorphum gilvum (strain LMG 25793 / CGMCC 1.9160 / SL003B-26A1) TaxID=991905 RepID=F2IZG6_POLGS|nr:NAD-glutamate dehydrogenase [Polymorphum gilvum]ADZ68589.1 Bacterial NAD-glutamate dehydrogenase superfamily [Polymorphum gilvum SL003B-26A1]